MGRLSSLLKGHRAVTEAVIEYVDGTDMQEVRDDFIKRLPEEMAAPVLVVGGASDEDAGYFALRNIETESIDISGKLAEASGRICGAPVSRLEYTELDAVDEYRAVWTRDGLVHLTYNELLDVLLRLLTSLKGGGLLYVSFICHSYEGLTDAGLFLDIDETAVKELIDDFCAFTIERIWVASESDGIRRVHLFLRKRK